ncbi:M28 family peptidase [Altererythrobacter sp. FM1]|uniref:M28 family peptidase n=1 Tax=Tsuneonella flava TaxID=2055955 RepID=UPI000C7FE531|nr:M28 family peptidase [Tsuneonella flava]ROT95507.1 M28 family peptidase [Altererythrobacter sp. FM1]
MAQAKGFNEVVERLGSGFRALLVLALLILVPACTHGGVPAAPRPADNAAIETRLMRDIATLSSDDFGGRQPGTDGEAKTLRFLSREWQAAGLTSGTNDPAHPWFAPVELAYSSPATSTVRFVRKGRTVPLPDSGVAMFASGARGLVELAPVVFVGNAGVDLERSELAGRVALMLWDHPGDADQREALLRQDAAAVIAVVKDDAELAHLANDRRRGHYRLKATEAVTTLDGYITREAADKLLGAGRIEELESAAAQDDFRPIPLGISVSVEATSSVGTAKTFNLIGHLPGKRPQDGAVLLMAHWDHFGSACAPADAADRICNGAVDNASGVAVLNELARQLGAGPKLDRDVYFLATTAEERGLLGAQAFTENPPVPLDSIVAAFNLDSVAIAPAGSAFGIVGLGMTDLDAPIERIIRESGGEMGDPALAAQFVRRQDGWALLQRDVPTVAVTTAYGAEKALQRFMDERYHKPSDEIDGIELGGAIDDLRLHLKLVRFFADPLQWPTETGSKRAGP